MGREAEVYRKGSSLPAAPQLLLGHWPPAPGSLGTTQQRGTSRELLKPPLVKTVHVHCAIENQQTPAFMVPITSILKPPRAIGTDVFPFTDEETGVREDLATQ